MKADQSNISEAEIQAFVDGQLGEDDRQRIASYLEQHPDEQQRIEAYRQQNDLLNQLYVDAPAQDTDKFRSYLRYRSRQPMFPAVRIAASILLLCVGVAAGWLLHGDEMTMTNVAHREASRLARDAAYAHAVYQPEVLHPVEVDSKQQDHLVKWLSKRLGKPLKTPDLSAQGFSLLGGRLLPSEYGPAAQFMYENKSGQRMTLYVVVEPEKNRDSAFRYFSANKINVFYWTDADMGFALSGEFSQSLLSKAANAVYRQLAL